MSKVLGSNWILFALYIGHVHLPRLHHQKTHTIIKRARKSQKLTLANTRYSMYTTDNLDEDRRRNMLVCIVARRAMSEEPTMFPPMVKHMNKL